MVVDFHPSLRKKLATDYWEDGKNYNASGGDRLVPKNLFGANLAYNIGSSDSDGNASANTSVERLDWHDEMSIFKIAHDFRPDVIIGSDLVYYPMDTAPLLQTLEILLKNSGGGDGGAKVDVLLLLPLPPNAEREALPDFRRRLENGELGDGCEVTMDEVEMVGRGNNDSEDDGERHNFLRVRIHYSQS